MRSERYTWICSNDFDLILCIINLPWCIPDYPSTVCKLFNGGSTVRFCNYMSLALPRSNTLAAAGCLACASQSGRFPLACWLLALSGVDPSFPNTSVAPCRDSRLRSSPERKEKKSISLVVHQAGGKKLLFPLRLDFLAVFFSLPVFFHFFFFYQIPSSLFYTSIPVFHVSFFL